MTAHSLRIVEGAGAARQSVLNRGATADATLPDAVQRSIVETFGEPLTAAQVVARIIEDVRREGDAAVKRYSQRFDGSADAPMEVTSEEIDAAFSMVAPELLEAVEFMADRVRAFHVHQRQHGPQPFTEHGLGMIVRPIQRAGIYMTGNVAVLPSSVVHTAVPAVAAGVEEIVGVTAALPDGSVHPLKLVASRLAGVQRVFRASGAQALAALAFGTESIPRVEKVFGPGNIFVTLAKQQLYGQVGIDALYGPTETVVLADDSASPDLCAADLLAQAEHDALARPVLITTSVEHARAVAEEVEAQLADLERGAIARAAIERGGAVVAADLDEAIALANEFAPEHLCLVTRDPEAVAARIQNAGGLFIGESSPEVLGDYVAGPSHVMPTGGSARFASPLTVNDFLKTISTIALSEDDLRRIGPYAAALARAEGLTGHARSIELRLEGR
ncbi:MAG TPA: histidinol dehydrogenase [Dehalococcoidia bacterium]|nr:histidinol dehydrogenase [Dehalococcoidia bacterium]